MSLSCSLSSTDYPISRAAKSQVLTSPNLLYSVPSPSLPSPFSLSSPTCSPQPLGWHLWLPPGSHLLTLLGCTGFLLHFKHARHFPASGPLDLPFPSVCNTLLQVSAQPSLLLPSGLNSHVSSPENFSLPHPKERTKPPSHH